MKIVDDRIDNAISVESPNRGGSLQARDTIIIHYTAGGDALNSVNWLCNPIAQASAHVVIGRDGRIYQLIPFDTVAWHAGRSSWKLPDGTVREGYNQYSLGIELDNAGILERNGCEYISWFGRSYGEGEVCFATHRNEAQPRYWHRFTEAQLNTVEELCGLLLDKYGLKYVLGHEEVSPLRKQDPGPAFPLEKIRDRILMPRRADGPELEEGYPRSGTVVSPLLLATSL